MEKLVYADVVVDIQVNLSFVHWPPGLKDYVLLKKKRQDFALLCQAIHDNNLDLIDYFLEGFDVNCQGDTNETLLSVALALNREEIMALLVSRGADYNLLDEEDKKKFIPFLLKIFSRGLGNFLVEKKKEREGAKRKFIEDMFNW
jgi:hypothetical protein